MTNTFKFIHGVISDDEIITDNDALIAAYSDGGIIAYPSTLTNNKKFQEKIVYLSANTDRKATIYTSTIDMLTPNCTVEVDEQQSHSLTIKNFDVGESHSLSAVLPDSVKETFQNVSNYPAASCTIQNNINWNRGSETGKTTSVNLSIGGKERTFNNCKFTITGKVTKTDFESANGTGANLKLYDSDLATFNGNRADFYENGKGYNESTKADTIKRTAYTPKIDSTESLDNVNHSHSSVNISPGYILSTTDKAPAANTPADGGTVNLSLPNEKGDKITYYLYKFYENDGFKCVNPNGKDITYDADVYLGEKVFTQVWDADLTTYKVGGEEAPASGPLYIAEGKTGIVNNKLMTKVDDNLYYTVKGTAYPADIDADNTNLNGNTISGKTDTTRFYTTVINGDISKTVTFTD